MGQNSLDPNSKELYEMYGSNTSYHTLYKTFFEDKDGYPNGKAYEHFAKHLPSSEEQEYYLACLSIDLRSANSINYPYGNYVLRSVTNSIRSGIKDCYIFRIQGEKFNVFVSAESLDEFVEFVTAPKEYCSIYCGLVEEPYVYEKNYEMIQKGIKLMYQDRFEQTNKKNSDGAIYGDKSNTPIELRETDTRKHRQTMWYSIISLKVFSPFYKDVSIYVFPTKLCKPLQSVPLLAVICDLEDYSVYYGNNVEMGVGGVIFNLNARFNRQGHLDVAFYKSDITSGQPKDYECKIDTHEGVSLPVNFGKRVGKDEIYPIKKNVENLCDYVLLKDIDSEGDHNPTINTTGIFEKDGIRYGLYMDDEYIDLIPFNGKENAAI